jgi:ribonuclease HI
VEVDVVLIQETKLGSEDRTPKLPGFAVARRDRPSGRRGGGLLTYVKVDLPFREVAAYQEGTEAGSLEALSVEILTGRRQRYTVVNVYAPPVRTSGTVHQDGGANLNALRVSGHHFFGGDFNGHSALWDASQPADAAGECVEEWMMSNALVPLNDGSATRINRGTGGLSAPDLSIAHSSLVARSDWCTLEPLGSDHLPILSELGLRVQTLTEERPRLRWNWKRADWPAYANALDQEVLEYTSSRRSGSLTETVSFLTGAMLKAASSCVGMVRARRVGKEWMTPEVADAIRERNRLGRNIADHRRLWVQACGKVRDLIAEAKRACWRSFVDSLEGHTQSTRAWGLVRSLSGKAPQAAERNRVLLHRGKEVHTDQGKADAFVNEYASVSRHERTVADRKLDRGVRRRLARASALFGPVEESCSDFTNAELIFALNQSNEGSAEGADGVSARFILKAGAVAQDFFLECCNRSFREGFCPQSWRDAVIVPILKEGKPAGHIDSYRPISLTSCLGKVMERLVGNRLKHLAEASGLWSEDQAGFRALRSTEDQVIRISQTVSDGFQAKPAKRTVMALLDFTKAYDTVWRSDLLGILMDSGIPFPIVRWIRGFLTHRRASVRLNGVLSKTRVFREGLPQGSVLSPMLFLFVINTLRTRLPITTEASFYADDVALWSAHPQKEVALSRLSESVGEVLRWGHEHKIRLNPNKCEVTFFSSDPRESSWKPEVHVADSVLRFNPNPVFLGVTYDRMLTFGPQVHRVASRVVRGSRLLGALSGREWGWRGDHLRTIFHAILSSVLHYCSAGWQPWLSDSAVGMLDRAQNKCLRLITGQLATTPVEALRCEARVPAVLTTLRRKAALALEKSLRLPPTNPRRTILLSAVAHRTKRRSSLREVANELVGNIGLSTDGRLAFPPVTTAPWRWGITGWSVHLSLKGGSCRHDPEAAKLADTVDTIRSLGRFDFIICTDGSAEGGVHRGGSAAVVFCGTVDHLVEEAVQRSRGAEFTSSFETEVSALVLGLEWLALNCESGRFLVCSDSRSALAVLDGGSLNSHHLFGELEQSLRRVRGEVVFQWIPGHSGFIGNERADQEAKAAATPPAAFDPEAQPRVPVSYRAAWSRIRQEIRDPPIAHERTSQVYSVAPKSFVCSRREEVVLAQLRSGHSLFLANYRHQVGQASSPDCPRCGLGPETLHHFLCECPATRTSRSLAFGLDGPSLSSLCRDPSAATLFFRELRLL